MWVGQGDGFPAAVTSTWIPLDPRVCTETQAHSTSAPGPYANQALLIHRGTQNTLTTCQDGHSQEIENKRQNHGAHTHTFTSDMFTHLTQGCAWTCSQPLHPPAHRHTEAHSQHDGRSAYTSSHVHHTHAHPGHVHTCMYTCGVKDMIYRVTTPHPLASVKSSLWVGLSFLICTMGGIQARLTG